MKKELNPWVAAAIIAGAAVLIVVYLLFCLNGNDAGRGKYLNVRDRGSAVYLDGKTALVVIMASDKSCTWDTSSEYYDECCRKVFDFTAVAAEWLAEQGKRYGKELSFVYPESADSSLLFYEGKVSADDITDKSMMYTMHDDGMDVWDYIDKNVRTDEIQAEYGCDNIAYLLFINAPDSSYPSYAFSAYENKLEKPYEFAVCSFSRDNELKVVPATIAHELLHTFGAPDFYTSDFLGRLYYVSDSFVEFMGADFSDDIMYSTSEDGTHNRYTDKITQQISPATAYYIGWLDTPPVDIDSFGMIHSQFDIKAS